MTGLHDGYKLYSSIYKSISVGSWKLDIKVWKEVKNWDREGLGWRCKGGLGRWAGSIGKSGRGGLYLDWFILERGHFTALGNSNEGKTLIFINIYSWWSEQEMVLQGLNLRGAEEPHLPWSHWETPVRSTCWARPKPCTDSTPGLKPFGSCSAQSLVLMWIQTEWEISS